MKTITFLRASVLASALLVSFPVIAQEETKFEITPSADLVSSYVWRGMYQTGAAIQPALTLSYGCLSLGVWGSSDFSTLAKEFDITLGYEIGGFGISVTDYWWEGEGSRYGNYSASHFFEGSVGYHFGEAFPLSLSWSTIFGMDGDKDADGDQRYSTYIEAGYDFSIKSVDVTASIGVSPWTGMYHREGKDGFALCAISLKASKEIKITDSFSFPIFAEAIIAPNQDNAYLVFGVSF